MAILSQAAQPLCYPSLPPLGQLIDNLVQMGKGQTADILPVGNNEMALVAVIVAVGVFRMCTWCRSAKPARCGRAAR